MLAVDLGKRRGTSGPDHSGCRCGCGCGRRGRRSSIRGGRRREAIVIVNGTLSPLFVARGSEDLMGVFVQCPEATLARVILGPLQFNEGLARRQIMSNRVLYNVSSVCTKVSNELSVQ